MIERDVIRTYQDFQVYKDSFSLAMEIFRITALFPKEERYSLVDQMRRAARSIPANLAEGWAKRKYESVFKKHLYDCVGSCEEMKVWLDFALECGYIDAVKYSELKNRYGKVGAMLFGLIDKWQTF